MMMILLAMLAFQDSQASAPKPAVPAANWVTEDDYPTDALRAHQAGSVGFTLAVGADGKVTGCKINNSSGSKILDDATCALLSQRATFLPAKDADGRAVAGAFASRFNWELPDGDTSLPLPTTVSKIEIDATYGPNGVLTRCKAIMSKDVLQTYQQLCERTQRNGRAMTVDGKPVTYHLVSTLTTQYRAD